MIESYNELNQKKVNFSASKRKKALAITRAFLFYQRFY